MNRECGRGRSAFDGEIGADVISVLRLCARKGGLATRSN